MHAEHVPFTNFERYAMKEGGRKETEKTLKNQGSKGRKKEGKMNQQKIDDDQRVQEKISDPRIYPYKHAHGICLGHNPDWEKVGKVRLEPNPDWFGADDPTRSCHGWAGRFKEVQTWRCKKCGREQVVRFRTLAICHLCGKIQDYNKEEFNPQSFGSSLSWD